MDWPGICERCEGGIRKIRAAGINREMKCSACNGTGERDLTADEAAEYLWGNNCNWYPEKCPTEAVQAGQVKSAMVTVHRYDGKEWKLFGFYEGDGLTAALNAACRAIRMGKNEKD